MDKELRPCKSRKDLEALESLAFDRLPNDPANIAKALKEMGCPFSCKYTSFSVVSTLKRHDTRIGANKVRLHFQLVDNLVEHGQDIVVSDVDITMDMFVSDIGTAFGLLLGK